MSGRVVPGSAWPNFYVVGAVKCGTTALWTNLRKHPQVFLPSVKEPHFFADALAPVPGDVADLHCPGERDRYEQLYRGAHGFAAVGDASPSYLWDESAARNIRSVCPHARIVIMLRDPIERAFSQYLMNVYIDNEALPFRDALERDYSAQDKGWWKTRLYVELGLYAKQVRRYWDLFGPEQVAVFTLNEMREAPMRLYANIAQHIGVSATALRSPALQVPVHGFKEARFPHAQRVVKRVLTRKVREALLPSAMNTWLRHNRVLHKEIKPARDLESSRFLQAIYGPDLLELEDLLRRNLPELRQGWERR